MRLLIRLSSSRQRLRAKAHPEVRLVGGMLPVRKSLRFPCSRPSGPRANPAPAAPTRAPPRPSQGSGGADDPAPDDEDVDLPPVARAHRRICMIVQYKCPTRLRHWRGWPHGEDDPTPIRRRASARTGRPPPAAPADHAAADRRRRDRRGHAPVGWPTPRTSPCGSTTYWFSSRQDMLREALEYFARLEIETLNERLDAVLGKRLSRQPVRRRVRRPARWRSSGSSAAHRRPVRAASGGRAPSRARGRLP